MTPDQYYFFIAIAAYLLGFISLWKVKNSGIWSSVINGAALLTLLIHPLKGNFTLEWFSVANTQFPLEFSFSKINYTMICFVQIISFFVQLFSIKYLKTDPRKGQYFSFLNLFIASMLLMVVSENLFHFFIFWELVGFCSYLIVGFWYQKEVATKASLKAFLYNRIGDVFFLIALFLCLKEHGTLNLTELATSTSFNPIIGYCFILGSLAKSAQFPLHLWLPDAMEGPTPASALIHAATMVAAGIFLLAKLDFIFTENQFFLIALIGGITSIIAAISALFQYDIKKVLAYSTISQLGFMFCAIGSMQSGVALLHLGTHGFFKAGLFLIAGAIIYYAHHEQDLRKLNTIKNDDNLVLAYILCFGSIIGAPLTAGFLSKDAIVLSVLNSGNYLVFTLLLISSFFTAMYMTRHFYLLFIKGKERKKPKISVFEVSATLLGFFTVVTLWSPSPFNIEALYLIKTLGIKHLEHSFALPIVLILLSILGIIFGVIYTKKEIASNYQTNWAIAKNHFYLDKLVNLTIIKPTFAFAKVASWTNNNIIDAATKQSSSLLLGLASAATFIEKFSIDALVNTVAKLVNGTSFSLKKMQGTKIQSYISVLLVVTLLIIFIQLLWA